MRKMERGILLGLLCLMRTGFEGWMHVSASAGAPAMDGSMSFRNSPTAKLCV